MELMVHQKIAVEKAKQVPNLALLMEAGVGKTAAMIHILRDEYNQRRKIARTLIFAPLSVCPQWKTEFAKFSKIPQEKIHVLTSAGPKRVKEIQAFKDPNQILVTNYESVGIQAFYAELRKWAPEIIVADESHRLKDPNSKRAKAIYPLSNAAQRKFILTGTPVLNSLMDIFGQYKFLDPTIFGAGFWSFRARYFYNKNAGKQFSFPEWIPHMFASREMGKIISGTSVQAKLEECIDLPELVRIKVPVELGVAQAKAFKEMKKDFLTEIKGKVVSAEFAMTKAIKMMQVSVGFLRPDDEAEPIWFDDVPRLDALRDTLESIGTQKVIIWTTFQPTYKKIGDLCEKLKKSYCFLTGEQTTKQKEESLEGFCKGDVQVLISNPAAGGTGLNLQIARYAIYYSRGYSLEHWLQSQARNYRSGSERHPSVVHYVLQSPGTLDAVVGAALDGKEDVADAVLAWANNPLDETKSIE